ncbi:hypothetical protein LCGC14_1858330 [marine sediment metagenome]|uniref:Cadherin domain-containing protein n=1 Tax=marine sediment metagenome TaxID=412755 RepID=A0A0F9G824_9ZZZZ
MKKKIIGILLFFIGFILVVFIFNTNAYPGYGDTHSSAGCHPGTGVDIETSTSSTINADLSSSFEISITATGPSGFSVVVLSADNNDLFTFNQSTVTDGGAGDLDSSTGTIRTVFSITAPDTSEIYTIIIIAKDSGSPPAIAFKRFNVNVGGATAELDVLGFVFDHLNYIIGGIAIVSLATATILYQINREKYTKIHGLLAGTSLILTTINVILIVPATVKVIGTVAQALNLHFLHIILGIIGYVAAIIAFLAGLSGHRTRIPGFVALGCWTFNYIQGLLLIFWGVGF